MSQGVQTPCPREGVVSHLFPKICKLAVGPPCLSSLFWWGGGKNCEIPSVFLLSCLLQGRSVPCRAKIWWIRAVPNISVPCPEDPCRARYFRAVPCLAVPGSWYQILVPGSWYQDLGTRILVPGSWYQDLGTRILVPRSWYQKKRRA